MLASGDLWPLAQIIVIIYVAPWTRGWAQVLDGKPGPP